MGDKSLERKMSEDTQDIDFKIADMLAATNTIALLGQAPIGSGLRIL